MSEHDAYLKALLIVAALFLLAAIHIRSHLKDDPRFAHLFKKRGGRVS